MKKKYAQVMACVLSLALLISGCAGSGSAESTGNTNGTDNALAFVNPTDSTDGTLATDPTGSGATEATGTGATEATGEDLVDPTETSGAATEATSPATSGSSSGSSSSGSSSSSSGGTSSGSTGTGNSSSGSSNSGSGSSSGNTGNTGSNSGGSSGGSSSGGSSSGGSGSGSSSGGSSSGSSGSEATTPTTEATEPTTEPVVVHTHSYKKTVVSPTCTASGYTVYTCSCGDSYTSDYVDALGHDWKSNGAVNEYYLLYVVECGCGERFHTKDEWQVHSDEMYAVCDPYTYYTEHCGWNSYQVHILTRSGYERICSRCGEEYFEDHTEEDKSDFQKWAEETGFISCP